MIASDAQQFSGAGLIASAKFHRLAHQRQFDLLEIAPPTSVVEIKIANFLMPFAAIVLVATCLISLFSLLVVSMESIGFAERVPWSYYQRLNIGVISVALPVVGMILFAVILLGLREKAAEAAKPAVIEGAIKLPMMKRKKEENRLKAAA